MLSFICMTAEIKDKIQTKYLEPAPNETQPVEIPPAVSNVGVQIHHEGEDAKKHLAIPDLPEGTTVNAQEDTPQIEEPQTSYVATHKELQKEGKTHPWNTSIRYKLFHDAKKERRKGDLSGHEPISTYGKASEVINQIRQNLQGRKN